MILSPRMTCTQRGFIGEDVPGRELGGFPVSHRQGLGGWLTHTRPPGFLGFSWNEATTSYTGPWGAGGGWEAAHASKGKTEVKNGNISHSHIMLER